MSKIITWEHYSSLYDNLNSEVEFTRLEARAEREVRAVIGPVRWARVSPDTFGYEQLQDCICNVINKILEYDVSAVGKGISSVSNDGYSENYTVQTESQVRAELQGSIRSWLSGTGLVGAY